MNLDAATEKAIHAVEDIAMKYAKQQNIPEGVNEIDISKIVVMPVAAVLLSIVLTGPKFGIFQTMEGEDMDVADIINFALARNGAGYRLVRVQ